MIENPLCATCIRMNKGTCTKNQVSPGIGDTCRYYIERDKIIPPPMEQVKPMMEEKTDIRDLEISRLRAEVERLKKLIPDPAEELLERYLSKFRECLERNVLSGYRVSGGKIMTILNSTVLGKLMDAGLVTKQDREVVKIRRVNWFTADFEKRIRERLDSEGIAIAGENS